MENKNQVAKVKEQELIHISQVLIGNENVNSVNARDLWIALESKQEFANWIKNRLNDSYAVEGQDFLINLSKTMEGGGRPQKEYILSLDLAKNISMLERNQKGNEVRKYFIECEKQLREASQFKLPQTYKEALLELVKQVEINEQLELENKEQKELITYQGEKLSNYEGASKARRSKQELATKLNRTIRKLAEQQFNRDYGSAYLYIYEKFRELHCIRDVVNMDFLKKNIDYLAECLEIATSELD